MDQAASMTSSGAGSQMGNMSPQMINAISSLMSNKKGQSAMPGIAQAAGSMMNNNLAVRNPNDRMLTNVPSGQPGLTQSRPAQGTQQMIYPQGGAGRFLNGASAQYGNYQSPMWNQQRANPQTQFSAPRLNAMPQTQTQPAQTFSSPGEVTSPGGIPSWIFQNNNWS